MGYFSNGSEGADFEERNCATCAHNDDEKGCPVWDAHLLFAYQESGTKSPAEQILSLLIPREGIKNRCAMRIAKGKS